MSMDIRFPIGFMFTITGLIITVWGLVSSPEIYKKSLNININLWTGLAMLAFGLLFLLMSLAAKAGVRKQGVQK
jgi:hypothetical protein